MPVIEGFFSRYRQKNDMNNKNTDNILDSLAGVKRAAVPDFFYTRLLARMEKGQEKSAASGWWILKPAYAVALIALVIVVNMAVVFSKNSTTDSVAADSDRFQAIAADYNLADNSSFYELNSDNK